MVDLLTATGKEIGVNAIRNKVNEIITEGVGGGVEVSASAPTGPSGGDLWYDTSIAELYVYVDNIGWIQANSGGGGGDVSDKRLKDNISNIENALDKLIKLSAVEFTWNDKQSFFTGNDVGLIAQEVEKLGFSIVKERPDGYLGLRYEKMIPFLVAAIKEQQELIEGMGNFEYATLDQASANHLVEASSGVSSVTDAGVGKSKINLTSAFSTKNYAIVALSDATSSNSPYIQHMNVETTSFEIHQRVQDGYRDAKIKIIFGA